MTQKKKYYLYFPETLRIFGKIWNVVSWEKLDSLGECESSTLTIRIHPKQSYAMAYQTLVHEIIEAVNTELELKLKHPQISSLETALFAIFVDNNLFKNYGKRYKKGRRKVKPKTKKVRRSVRKS